MGVREAAFASYLREGLPLRAELLGSFHSRLVEAG